MTADWRAEFRHSLSECLGENRDAPLGVAVSGGGDSTALLLLLTQYCTQTGTALEVVTVDHGLRPEAALEARAVAGLCARLGWPHTVLHWHRQGASGNLQQAAREARRRLISDWAQARGIKNVALGHTMDDQAETFLLRLARGSGVDGLAAMPLRRYALGIGWIRPLLAARRDELRDFLRRQGVEWAEDPGNENTAYDRIKARKLLAEFSGAGLMLDVPTLSKTADRLHLARRALEQETARAARRLARVSALGSVTLGRDGLMDLSDEIRRRLFSHALMWVSGAVYRPRLDGLLRALDAALAGRRTTLSGCLIAGDGRELRVSRELSAVAALKVAPDALWDERWQFQAAAASCEGLHLAALGEAGLAQLDDWRAAGVARDILSSAPAVWRDTVLVAAPLAGVANGWTCRRVPACDEFATAVLSH